MGATRLSTTDIDIHEGIADDFESLANRSRPIPPHPGGETTSTAAARGESCGQRGRT